MDFTDTDTTIPSTLPEDDVPRRREESPKKHPIFKILLLGVLFVVLFIVFTR
jgi:hypothetical protein